MYIFKCRVSESKMEFAIFQPLLSWCLHCIYNCFYSIFLAYQGDSTGKEPICNSRDLGLTPGLGGSPGEGNGNPLQYSGLENSMDCMTMGSWGHSIRY